jgi:hypothetical protein
MNNNLVIWFKGLAEGWKIASTLIGMITIISVIAVKIDHWKDKRIDQANVIEYLKQAEHDQKQYNRMKDSIEIIWKIDLTKKFNFISDSIGFIYRKQSSVINSVDVLASKVSKSIDEYKNIMGDLRNMKFELVQPEPVKSVFGKASVRIISIPKDSIK